MPQPKSSSSSSRRTTTTRAKRTATNAQRESMDRTQQAMEGLRERLTRGVVVTAESIQETLEEAVRRGRMTRSDAQTLGNDLVERGRRQAEDFLRDVEVLLGRGRAQAGRQAVSARRQATQRGDRVLREVDRARRAAGIGSFPILGYDDLDARRIVARLPDLAPADLRRVRTYEQRSRNRKTILRAIEKQLA